MAAVVSGKKHFDDGKKATESGDYSEAMIAFTLAWNQSNEEKNEKLMAVSLKMLGDLYRLLKQVRVNNRAG